MPSANKMIGYRPDPTERAILEAYKAKTGLPFARVLALALREKADREDVRGTVAHEEKPPPVDLSAENPAARLAAFHKLSRAEQARYLETSAKEAAPGYRGDLSAVEPSVHAVAENERERVKIVYRGVRDYDAAGNLLVSAD